LLEPGNVQQLADALQSIIESTPEEIQIKQQASLKRITKFTWENIAKQTAEAIGKFCRGH